MEHMVPQHTKEHIREEIFRLLKYAPPEMRVGVLGLFPAAKRTLDQGYRPSVRGVPLRSCGGRPPGLAAPSRTSARGQARRGASDHRTAAALARPMAAAKNQRKVGLQP